MASVIKLYRLLFFVVSLIALSGCSVFNEFYVINKTGEPTIVTIKLSMSLEELQKMSGTLQLTYADTILKISVKTRDVLTKTLDYELVNQYELSIEIPARSTVLIGGATNKLLYADSIRFTNKNSDAVYSLSDISKNVKRSGGLFPPFQYTYIVQNE